MSSGSSSEVRPLPRSFYSRDAILVARELLGKVLTHDLSAEGTVAGRIVEVEAYLAEYNGEVDRAAHASRGITDRTRVLFGPPGHAYVYLSYGMHECLNVVAEQEGRPGCVLIRALEPVTGLQAMRERRLGQKGGRALKDEDLANGPGKLTQALGITRELYGADLTRGPLVVSEERASKAAAREPVEVAVSPRIGIAHCADWPLRFYIAGNRFVSRAR